MQFIDAAETDIFRCQFPISGPHGVGIPPHGPIGRKKLGAPFVRGNKLVNGPIQRGSICNAQQSQLPSIRSNLKTGSLI